MSAIYVETSIVGYLTARSAFDVVFQAREELTRRWWQQRRNGFDLHISQLVLDEAGAGDPTAAADRRERPPPPFPSGGYRRPSPPTQRLVQDDGGPTSSWWRPAATHGGKRQFSRALRTLVPSPAL